MNQIFFYCLHFVKALIYVGFVFNLIIFSSIFYHTYMVEALEENNAWLTLDACKFFF